MAQQQQYTIQHEATVVNHVRSLKESMHIRAVQPRLSIPLGKADDKHKTIESESHAAFRGDFANKKEVMDMEARNEEEEYGGSLGGDLQTTQIQRRSHNETSDLLRNAFRTERRSLQFEVGGGTSLYDSDDDCDGHNYGISSSIFNACASAKDGKQTNGSLTPPTASRKSMSTLQGEVSETGATQAGQPLVSPFLDLSEEGLRDTYHRRYDCADLQPWTPFAGMTSAVDEADRPSYPMYKGIEVKPYSVSQRGEELVAHYAGLNAAVPR